MFVRIFVCLFELKIIVFALFSNMMQMEKCPHRSTVIGSNGKLHILKYCALSISISFYFRFNSEATIVLFTSLHSELLTLQILYKLQRYITD